MNKMIFSVWLCSLISFFVFTANAGETGLLKDGTWIKKIRKDHPRLFFNADNLPAIRKTAEQRPAQLKELLKKADSYPADPQYRELTDLFTRNQAGVIKPRRPGMHARMLLEYAGGEEAAVCALAWLFTGEEHYRVKACQFLKIFVKALQFSADGACWIDSAGNTRINAILAYDILYNTLTPEERRDFILPLVEYTRNAQKNGKFKFRRTVGLYKGGNYGEDALEYFLGLAIYGDGIADKEAEAMLRRGAALFVKMMDHRDWISDGSGLLASLTLTYAFSTYPYATHFFLYSWQSAFGEDISGRWEQMLHYHRYVEGMTFLPDARGERKFHGIGDVMHLTNTICPDERMYTHIANNIHLFGKKHPAKAREMYAFLATMPAENSYLTGKLYPVMPFLSTGFEPALVKPGIATALPYFYNAGFGFLAMWSGRGAGDTYAGFRFGGTQFIHQQYDDLSFVIYKHDFLALDSGSRTETAHHHNFGCQTVAHNSLLIHMEKEPMAHFWKPWGFKPDGKTYYSHGGQNSTLKGKALALQSGPDYIYAAGDGTANYSDKKCKEVTRQFVWLKPDIFVIYDRVTSVLPEQKKEFLLHFQNKPEFLNKKTLFADAGKGRLFVQQLLPENAELNLVGGPGKEFYASGRNWPLNPEKTYQYAGSWRLETAPAKAANEARFLHVLQAADTGVPQPVPAKVQQLDQFDQVSVNGYTLRFRRNGEIGLIIEKDGVSKTLPNKVERL